MEIAVGTTLVEFLGRKEENRRAPVVASVRRSRPAQWRLLPEKMEITGGHKAGKNSCSLLLPNYSKFERYMGK